MRKPFIILLSAVLLGLCMNSSVMAENEAYRIGAILPLSGEYASLGTYLKNGLTLAYEELPDSQRKLVSIVYEDDQLQSAQSVSAFRKLTEVDAVDAVFVLGSGVGNAVAPLAEQKSKLMIAIGASDKSFVLGKEFVFIHWVSPESEAKTMVDEILRRGYQRLAIIAHEQEGAMALEEALRVELQARDLSERLLLSERVLTDVRDFKTTIAKLRARDVDGVCAILLPGGLGAFVRQARDLRLDAEIFGFELFEDENEVKVSDGALVGKWYVNADQSTDEFRSSYQKKFGQHPGWAAANAYDSLKLLAAGLEAVGPDNERLAQYLRSIRDYQGASGTYSATKDNRFALPATVKVVRADGFEKLSASETAQ